MISPCTSSTVCLHVVRLVIEQANVFLGMNDVLPKPFTKEGLLQMLEKHLAHLKKPVSHLPSDTIVAPQPMAAARQIMKEEESPAKSPVTTWANSPNQIPGVSPVGSTVTDEYMQAVHANASAYAPGAQMAGNMAFPSPGPAMQAAQAAQAARQHASNHRRQISDISGGDDMNNPAKRQQTMYANGALPPQPMNPMQRPR